MRSTSFLTVFSTASAPIFFRRHLKFFAELANEISRVTNAYALGDLSHGHLSLHQQIFCTLQAVVRHKAGISGAELRGKQPAEMGSGVVERLRYLV